MEKRTLDKAYQQEIEAERPAGWRRLRGKQTVEKRRLDKAYQQEIQVDPEDEHRTAVTPELKNPDEGKVLGVTHAEGCSAPDTGCCKSTIGEETMVRHETATGRKARWLKDLKPMRFRGFDGSAQESIGAIELDWPAKSCRATSAARAAPGAA